MRGVKEGGKRGCCKGTTSGRANTDEGWNSGTILSCLIFLLAFSREDWRASGSEQGRDGELVRSNAIAKSWKSVLIREPLVNKPIWRKVDLLEADTSGSRAPNLPFGK